jgi:hypothetical protein
MVESGVDRIRIDTVGKSELLQVVQALQDGSVQQFKFEQCEELVTVQSRAEDL